MDLKEIMDIDVSSELKNRTWWWWFWLFFFKPDDGGKWKQLMILWGTRNCRKLKIDDMTWENKGVLKRKKQGLEVPGITAAWYFDGKRMIDPLFLKQGKLTSTWAGNNPHLTLESAGHSTFSSSNGNFKIKAKFEDLDIDLDVSEWKPHLYNLVPTGKNYFGFLGYKMLKIRACKAEGFVKTKDTAEEVEGTTYFQKVRINSPTSPWYFGTFHSARGDYMDYFMPHIGSPIFRRTARHDSKLYFWEKNLSKGIHFVEANGMSHNIKNLHITKAYEDDMPIFYLNGSENGKTIEMEMRPYSRACWRVEQPLLHVLSTILHYNEYPTYVRKLRFNDRGREVTLEDTGFTVGNCEHAWGIV
jgi:hypothetical protein